MARSHRFHLDRGGHSVTVQTGTPSGYIELLVDGKVVAAQRERRRGVTVLVAELPGDTPRPFTIRIDRSHQAGHVPLCVMEADGHRDPMPYAPLAAPRSSPPTVSAPVHPIRWLRRVVRRRLRHSRVRSR